MGDVDFGFSMNASDGLYVMEDGVTILYLGLYSTSDVFRVEARYGAVQYLKNGSVVYTSTMTPTYPLRVDSPFYDTGATVKNVYVGNTLWKGASGVSISTDELTKTGTNSAWDAGASSANTIEYGDGFVEFTATETTKAPGCRPGNRRHRSQFERYRVRHRPPRRWCR
jgi:hypothetical protein